MSNAQIASQLYISEGTVKRHLTNIYTKLDATRYVLGVVPGDAKIDLNAVRNRLGGTYVSFASPDIAERLAGSVAGTILPFSFHPELELIIDPSLREIDELYVNAARLDRSVALRTSDYLAIAQRVSSGSPNPGPHPSQATPERPRTAATPRIRAWRDCDTLGHHSYRGANTGTSAEPCSPKPSRRRMGIVISPRGTDLRLRRRARRSSSCRSEVEGDAGLACEIKDVDEAGWHIDLRREVLWGNAVCFHCPRARIDPHASFFLKRS